MASHSSWGNHFFSAVDSTIGLLYDEALDIGAVDTESDYICELRVLAEHPINTGDHSIAYELEAKPYIPLFDLEGNPRVLYSLLRGKVMETYRYTPDGAEEILDYWGSKLSQSKAANPWRYRTWRLDEETGLYYVDGEYLRP